MSKYQLPFTSRNVVELGGDLVKPNFRPNLNMMPGPAVDTIADFNDPLPLESGRYDGIFSMYVIEHVKHRKLRHFIAECHRILRPGGYAVFFTANLLAQCERVVRRAAEGTFNDEDVHMIFAGDPDWVGNYHVTGFTPDWAVKLFQEAGFSEVNIVEHPQTVTDMIIEAKK